MRVFSNSKEHQATCFLAAIKRQKYDRISVIKHAIFQSINAVEIERVLSFFFQVILGRQSASFSKAFSEVILSLSNDS